jgi:hypothetical protein
MTFTLRLLIVAMPTQGRFPSAALVARRPARLERAATFRGRRVGRGSRPLGVQERSQLRRYVGREGIEPMRTWTSGRRTIVAFSLTIFAGTFAVAATAVPIDLTGHWTGAATGKSQSPVTLAADMTSSGRTVTGTVTATQDGQADACTLNGRQTGRVKFRAKLTPCKVVLQGKFDAATDSITGHYVGHGHHKRETGTFSLTRAASPSGAFIDNAAGH